MNINKWYQIRSSFWGCLFVVSQTISKEYYCSIFQKPVFRCQHRKVVCEMNYESHVYGFQHCVYAEKSLTSKKWFFFYKKLEAKVWELVYYMNLTDIRFSLKQHEEYVNKVLKNSRPSWCTFVQLKVYKNIINRTLFMKSVLIILSHLGKLYFHTQFFHSIWLHLLIILLYLINKNKTKFWNKIIESINKSRYQTIQENS